MTQDHPQRPLNFTSRIVCPKHLGFNEGSQQIDVFFNFQRQTAYVVSFPGLETRIQVKRLRTWRMTSWFVFAIKKPGFTGWIFGPGRLRAVREAYRKNFYLISSRFELMARSYARTTRKEQAYTIHEYQRLSGFNIWHGGIGILGSRHVTSLWSEIMIMHNSPKAFLRLGFWVFFVWIEIQICEFQY